MKLCGRYLPEIYSAFLKYDPLSNVDFTDEYTRELTDNSDFNNTQNANSNSSSTANSTGLNVNSDTPQRTDFKVSNFGRFLCV